MKKILIVFVIFGLVGSAAACSSVDALSGKSMEEIEFTANEFIEILSSENYGEARIYLDETLAQAIPERTLRSTWEGLTDQYGPFLKKAGSRIEESGNDWTVNITCLFREQAVDAKLVLNDEGYVSGLFFVQTGSFPEVDEETFKEVQLVVDAGDYPLPAVLTLPTEGDNFPAVILVHNSMLSDKNATIGPNKMFRDLSWELASRGIAVLRYNKRSYEYNCAFANNYTYTAEEDIIEDALAAAKLLTNRLDMDHSQILVLGHGLGGTISPRLAKRSENVSGLIIMSGVARPIEKAVESQFEYLYSKGQEFLFEDKSIMDRIERDLEELKEIYEKGEVLEKTVLGYPASYWLDLHEYEAASYAAHYVDVPMLILQGKRDYQATEEDLRIWKEALKGKDEVTFQLYPKLNHIYMEGEGDILPSEYIEPGNVEKYVIEDIVEWIQSLS